LLSEHFSLQILFALVKNNGFYLQAGLSDLEQCPFCPFATIMDVPKEINKLFECQNPECGEASCRLCREVSHIPLRCEEVEKDDEVRMRTYIENKMAEAMIRSCYNCNRPYIKQV
jgi:TRIAD3 protein (E3 ubiquitin-protein ligase RNF216)